MIITHKLCTDLQNRTIQSRLNMVQCDRNSRAIEISLTNDGVDWDVQSLDNVFFRYRKSDGTGGSYDSMKVWYLDFKLRLLKNSRIFFSSRQYILLRFTDTNSAIRKLRGESL